MMEYKEGCCHCGAEVELMWTADDMFKVCTDCNREYEEIKAACKEGIAAMKAGRVKPWGQVKEELGIEGS